MTHHRLNGKYLINAGSNRHFPYTHIRGPSGHPRRSIQQEKPSFYDEQSSRVVPIFQTSSSV